MSTDNKSTRWIDYKVTQIEDGWIIIKWGEKLAGPFPTNNEAWLWVDRNLPAKLFKPKKFHLKKTRQYRDFRKWKRRTKKKLGYALR